MSELDEYHQNLMADIRREADASGVFPVEAFFDRMTERLTEAGELEVADRAYYQSGEGGQKLRIDGYAGDPRDSEGVLGLIVCDFADSEGVQTFGKGDVPPILNPLIRFLKKAKTEEFRDALNEANPAFQVSDLIITTWSQVTKVKLILISNRQYIGRDDTVKLADFGEVPITWSVWDLARFERFDRSGQAREDMVIDFATDFGAPLPALKASQTGAALESYLLIVCQGNNWPQFTTGGARGCSKPMCGLSFRHEPRRTKASRRRSRRNPSSSSPTTTAFQRQQTRYPASERLTDWQSHRSATCRSSTAPRRQDRFTVA
jgi:hypothetical protein